VKAERRAFSVSVFAKHEGRLLLIKHARLGLWLPIGGEVETGETPLEAAKRELREEAQLEGTFRALPGAIDGTPAGLLGYEEHLAGSKGRHLNFAFVAEVESELVVANDEYVEFRWVDDPSQVDAPLNVLQLARLCLGTADPLVAVAKAWIAAFNARDLDALLALYGEDAVHTSPKLRDRQPETKGEIRGKAALRAWWADSYARLLGLRYEERHVTATGERVFLEYDRVVPGEAVLRVAELFVVREGKIRESRVFHG